MHARIALSSHSLKGFLLSECILRNKNTIVLVVVSQERAEHTMLVDLGRNDVGKVAIDGSVKIQSLMDIERYSHVMHISSTVRSPETNHI